MPPEIADSDAESDVDTAPLDNSVEINNLTATPACLVNYGTGFSPSTLNFDQFLSPTQNLSDPKTTDRTTPIRGTDSTNRILNGVNNTKQPIVANGEEAHPAEKSIAINQDLVNDPNNSTRKRRHTAIEENSGVSDDLIMKKKRPKTYGSKAGSNILKDLEYFATMSTSAHDQSTSEPVKQSLTAAGDTAPESYDHAAEPARERDRPRRVISLLGDSVNNVGHQLSTSSASMGAHKSINLDFRGSDQGMDVNANPFGAPSQTSVDGDQNTPDHERLARFFTHPDTYNAREYYTESISGADEISRHASPTSNTINPIVLSTSDSKQAQNVKDGDSRNDTQSSKRRKTDVDTALTQSTPIETTSTRRAVSLTAEFVSVSIENPPPKKRGRKSKHSARNPHSPAPDAFDGAHGDLRSDDQPMELPTELTQPRLSRSRAGTVDSISHTSETSETNRKRKRTRKKSSFQDTEAEAASIGDQTSSPTKLPTSELNLSDETIIGLPKENYVPRPSRSRAKQVVDENKMPPPVRKQKTPSLDDDSSPVKPSPIKSAKKSTKKSKVKRAKTSAAALSKKSEQMLSEGEEDVIWMEERPATVKLELPTDLKELKKEKDQDIDLTAVGMNDEAQVTDVALKGDATLSVEFPQPTETNEKELSKQAEPKKRGRKPKKQTVHAEPAGDTDVDNHQVDESLDAVNVTKVSRPALVEKTSNISITIPVKRNITVSNSANSHEKQNHSQPNTAEDDQGKNTPIPSPAKQTSESPSSKPTHSPLKATASLTQSALSRYRVGLSKRQTIPSLLRRVDKNKAPPKVVVRKEKESKKKNADVDEDGEPVGFKDRDENGNLIEWEF